MRLFQEEKSYKDWLLAADDAGQTVTYRDLDFFTEEFYRYIGGKKLIFILCQNTIGSLFGYLGCLKTGVVPLMLEKHINQELLMRLIREYRPAFLYIPEDCLLKAEECEVVWKTQGYCLCRRKEKLPPSLYGELSLLLTTSGSTGSPKLVRQSGRNIDANTESICKYLNINEKERPVTTLPMNYTYGLSIINSHVKVGASLLLTVRSMVEQPFWDYVKEKKATSFGGVPYTYQVLKRIGFLQMDLPDLRTMTQAGGKLPMNLHKEFASYAEKTGKQFVVMYGQTEATARMGYLPAAKAVERCGSMGVAIPGGRFWLEDDKGKEIKEPDTQGELVYEGENVALGYACCPEDLKKEDEWKGILHTGDMAKRDQDGYYYITGRKKRFIKMFGNRVNLDEAERLLKEHFEGIDFACVGTDDNLVIYTDHREESGEELILEHLYQMTGINSRAIRIRLVDKIPKNQSGKTLYKELL
ncbi:MAG: AMP-binding protein [Hungatella sp.]|jgi:acyl-coenzyme A synthetase/AMP-(fatty) acid ligase|nr:AMP-binding protein [Hungatella sp.]